MTKTAAALAVNAGSSSVKCALFTATDAPREIVRTHIEGAPSSSMRELIAWVIAHAQDLELEAAGHRVVHGGADYRQPQRVTPALLDALTRLIPFAPNHLPEEIGLIQALGQRWPELPQVACFDTAFHADLPDVARRLPIPSLFEARGVRKYGFHGLSYAFLVEELTRLAGPEAAAGRLVLAHLGNGSSLAAVRNRRSIDTTMAFTPIGGVVMSTRSGDLDPGILTYIARTERLTPDQVEDLISQRAGLLGISDQTGDMRMLLRLESDDPACRLAVAIYAYSIKKAIGSFATVLGGLDTLVFSGGIGEHAPAVRSRICDGLGFLDVELDRDRNDANAAIISLTGRRVTVRVMPTNEELMIARGIHEVLSARVTP